MKKLRVIVRAAAGLPAAALLSGALAAGPPASEESAKAVPSTEAGPAVDCRITPNILDVSRAPGALIAQIEFPIASGETPPVTVESVSPGVYISSVNGVRLPEPSPYAEGLGERLAGRIVADRADVRRRVERPNGIPELIVRFDRPSDGNHATLEDGDAGDVLAMMMDLPDGHSAPICVAGMAAGASFECCDTVAVRNKGLRDRPRGLIPHSSP